MGRILIPKLPGIAVASTSQVNLTVPFFYYFDGIHTKKINGDIFAGSLQLQGEGISYYADGYGNAYQNIILSPNSILYDLNISDVIIGYQYNWTLWQVQYDYENGYWYPIQQSTNPSTNLNYVPTTNWSPSITITSSSNKISIKKQNLGGGKLNAKINPPAAPSGIPVATTNELIVTDPEGLFSGTYLKDGQGMGGYQPLGGDNGLFYNGSWYFYNSDSGRTRSHPTATDPNFIPETGWQDAITITAT